MDAPVCIHCRVGIRLVDGRKWIHSNRFAGCDATPAPTPMTKPQEHAYEVLKEHGPLHPREFARRMWPDSKAWGLRTRGRNNHPGAMGGTMPMKGAVMLWKLHDLQLSQRNHNGSWQVR
ncbi:hypothetical protein SEA_VALENTINIPUFF_27 [Microbacterium phage ValentiniPuff]|uniref:Uncharacterized protein n=1 Tax=Microbacterium phage ValentiniPuff TaxID=2315705 RepID=A0A386KQT7_9CAUD|nr:hypothetical protein SEA_VALENTINIPUFF_27 [Microbacterium phage ValentiniPuff]